jgi:hypothetical protein
VDFDPAAFAHRHQVRIVIRNDYVIFFHEFSFFRKARPPRWQALPADGSENSDLNPHVTISGMRYWHSGKTAGEPMGSR